MELEDLINLIMSGQNIEIIDYDTEEIYFNGLTDDLLDDSYDRLSTYTVCSIASCNDCDYDDYLKIWVS